MNKKVLVIVVVLLLLLGGGAYVMSRTSSAPASGTTMTASPTAAPTTAQTQGTLKSLLTAGKPQTCTFTSQNGNTTGTLYVADGKMAGDFTTTTQGNTVTAHVIVASGFSYVWTGMTKMGFKMALTDLQPTPGQNSQSVGLNETVSYSCKDWSTDTTKFTLPTDMTFSTIKIPTTSVQTGATTSGGTGASSACSACDNIPAGAAQTACKTQLHCQ